jgi:hypothetical protein
MTPFLAPRRSLPGSVPGLAGALALIACACVHAPPVAGVAGEEAAARPPPPFVVVTGSRIPQRVDLRSGLAATTSPVRIYSRAQLLDTGRDDDLGAALRVLDPDVVIHR